MARHAYAFGHTLQAIDLHLGPAREIALVGADAGELEAVVRGTLRPRTVLAGATDGARSRVPLLRGRSAVDGRAAAYVCERFSCLAPVTDAAELAALLG